MKIILLFCCLVSSCFSEKPKFYVIFPKVQDTEYKKARQFHRYINLSLSQTNYFNVLTREEAKVQIEIAQEHWPLDCQTSNCMNQIAKAMDVEWILTTTWKKRGDHYTLLFKLWDTKNKTLFSEEHWLIPPSAIKDIPKFTNYWVKKTFGFVHPNSQLPEGITPLTLSSPKEYYLPLVFQGLLGAGTLLQFGHYFWGDSNQTKASQTISPSSQSSLPGFFHHGEEGARYQALGRAGSSLADDLHSLFWNPAGLAHLVQSQWNLQRSRLVSGPPGISLAWGGPLGNLGGQGHSMHYRGDSLASEWLFRSGWSMDLTFLSRITRQIRFGFVVKGLLAKIGSHCSGTQCSTGQIFGASFDIGLQSSPTPWLDLGSTWSNIYSFVSNNNTLRDKYYNESLPRSLRIGMTLKPQDTWVLQSECFLETLDSKNFRYSIGAEKDWGLLQIRAGLYDYETQGGGMALTGGVGTHFQEGKWRLSLSYGYEIPIVGLLTRSTAQTFDFNLYY